MSDTATLISVFLNRAGIDAATPTHVTRPIVANWLNEAQRKLCASGRLLATIWRGKSQADAEFYELPGEFYQIVTIEIRDSVKNIYRQLGGMSIVERPTPRPAVDGDIPTKFMIWGANALSGSTDNKPVIVFNKKFGHTSADFNMYIYARQKPKDMGDAGQGPEVQEYWQDGMKDYAEYRLRNRIANSDRQQLSTAKDMKASWEKFLEESKEYRYDAMLVPTYAPDTAQYLDPRDGTTNFQ